MGLIAFQLEADGSEPQETVAQVAPPPPAPSTTSTTLAPTPEPTVAVPANPNIRPLTPEERALLGQRLEAVATEEEPAAEEVAVDADPTASASPEQTPEPTPVPTETEAAAPQAVTPEPTPDPTPEPTPDPTPEPTATADPTDEPDDSERSEGSGMPEGTTEEMWHELRECESSNNYKLVHGQYHGAYQFSPDTWDWLAADYYPDLVGVLPSEASPADQDKMAYKLYEVSGKGQWPVCGQHLP